MLLLIILLFSINSQAAIIEGNTNGNIILVEIFDYQCNYCKASYPIILKLMDRNPDLKIKLMPVAILNSLSLYEAAASVAASHYPQKFQTLNNQFMLNTVSTKAEITNILNHENLNNLDFKNLMHSTETRSLLREDLGILQSVKVSTPLFIIYKKNNLSASVVLKGYQTFSVMQHAIEQVR